MTADDYGWFVSRVKAAYGIDLGDYKETQMKRRLNAFRAQSGCPDFRAFFNKMASDEAVKDAFLDRMTINVSSFYRNSARWHTLEHDVLPGLLSDRTHFNVWSAACSTGEEAYTIAMILSKYMPLSNVSILATDIDEKSLRKAKSGFFNESSLQELPDAFKTKFFQKREGSGYEINERLKKAVRFKKHNLLTDRANENFDLIICRNALIYFADAAKDRLYRTFFHSLRPGGILFVGSTEQIFNPEKYGLCLEKTFFYRKTVEARDRTIHSSSPKHGLGD